MSRIDGQEILARARERGLYLGHTPAHAAVAAMAAPEDMISEQWWEVVEVVVGWMVEAMEGGRQKLPGEE